MLARPYPDVVALPAYGHEVKVEVERLVICELFAEQLITLREKQGERRINILIGVFEATAIDRALKGASAPRPLAHDGWLLTIGELGGELRSVCVNDFHDGIYYTELRIDFGDSERRVDVRPSDAIVLALKAGRPILAIDRLFGASRSSNAERT